MNLALRGMSDQAPALNNVGARFMSLAHSRVRVLNDLCTRSLYAERIGEFNPVEQRSDRAEQGGRQLIFIIGRERRNKTNVHGRLVAQRITF
jgi:hypothetical protein